jgi:hypothetical protein
MSLSARSTDGAAILLRATSEASSAREYLSISRLEKRFHPPGVDVTGLISPLSTARASVEWWTPIISAALRSYIGRSGNVLIPASDCLLLRMLIHIFREWREWSVMKRGLRQLHEVANA